MTSAKDAPRGKGDTAIGISRVPDPRLDKLTAVWDSGRVGPQQREEMSRLIDGLLKLSRIMRAELKIEELDISQMAEDIVEELRSREEGRDIEVLIQPHLRAEGRERFRFNGKAADRDLYFHRGHGDRRVDREQRDGLSRAPRDRRGCQERGVRLRRRVSGDEQSAGTELVGIHPFRGGEFRPDEHIWEMGGCGWKQKNRWRSAVCEIFRVERAMRFELTTSTLARWRSTTELRPRC